MTFLARVLPVLALLLPLSPAVRAKPAEADPFLDALTKEAERSTQSLKDQRDAPLYYLSYRVRDGVNFDLSASFGALDTGTGSDDALSHRTRVLDVSVRVGSPKLDNTHHLRGSGATARAGEHWAYLPLEDDPGALQMGIWRVTDRAYRAASDQLIRVKANKAVKVEEEDEADDFSPSAPQDHLDKVAAVSLDRKAWRARLKSLSALFKDHPHILYSTVALGGGYWTNYYVDNAGARIRESQSLCHLSITGTVKADDGMDLYLNRIFTADVPDHLPREAELKTQIAEMIAQLETLRTAPVVEPYSGPAIITNRAAGVFFHEIFGHRVEGGRQKDADEGHTFTHKVGQQVVPEFISVNDDPTRSRYGDTVLNGHYLFDEEGVPAQKVSLVDNGVLEGFLMSRSPIRGFASSNGHGRAQVGLAPVARQGNLIVSSTHQVPFAQLRQQLIDELKKQGKPYGLIFEDISGGFTQTRTGAQAQAFTVLPLIVKRVYPDGRPDQLVRGVNLVGTPLQSFEKILATGDDFAVFDGFCGAESGWVPVSAVAPSLLIGEIEVERRAKSQERAPILPPPLHPGVPWATEASNEGSPR